MSTGSASEAGAPRYDWLASESAPSGSPMQLLDGHLRLGSVRYPLPVGRWAHSGWGLFGSSRDLGAALKPLPDGLFLRYFSFVEDTFYEGRFDLPEGRMEALFAEGLTSRIDGAPVTWDRIVVGAGPEGHVSVWVAAEGRVREVATFVAAPAEVPWTRLLDDPRHTRAEYVAQVLASTLGEARAGEVARTGVTPGAFERRKRQHAWRFDLRAEVIPSGMWMYFVNGERAWFNLMRPIPPRTHRALPSYLRLDWSEGAARSYAIVDFDPDETARAFEHFVAADRGDLRLEIDLGDTRSALALYLRDAGEIYPFRSARIKVGRRG